MIVKAPVISSYLRNVSMQDSCNLSGGCCGQVPLAETLAIIIDSTFEPATRMYWTASKERVMAGVEPARALARWPLSKAERDQIATIQSVDQLAEVYAAIAEERGMMAKADQRRITILGIVMMMFFFGATVLTMIYLLTIQNQSFLDNITSIKN